MNMPSSKKVNEIKKSFKDLLSLDSKKEKVEHNEHMIMFRCLSEVEGMMEELGINKRELAKRLGTSASYITQLFRGDKVINLNTLAKIEVEFDKTFNIKLLNGGESNEMFSASEDEIIKYLNGKANHEGCWVFHKFKKSSNIPSLSTYSELEDISKVA